MQRLFSLSLRRNGRFFSLWIVLSFAFLLTGREAGGLVPFLDGGVFVSLEGKGTYDSNIFGNASEDGDFFATLTPAVEYRRDMGLLHLEVLGGVEVFRFWDFTDQDSEDFFSLLGLTYPNRPDMNPQKADFTLEWRQQSETDEDVGDRVRSEILDLQLLLRSVLSGRLALRGSGAYNKEWFQGGSLSEVDIWMPAVDLIYVYSKNLEMFMGYRYRHTSTAGSVDRSLDIDDHLAQVGAEGQIASRTVGLISAGIQSRNISTNESGNTLRPFGSVALEWTPRTRTKVTILVEKDFDVTANDRSVDETAFGLILNQGVYRGLSFEPRVSYVNARFSYPEGGSRQDDRYQGGLAFLYDFAGGASMALGYRYENQSSNRERFTYDRHILDISASITF